MNVPEKILLPNVRSGIDCRLLSIQVESTRLESILNLSAHALVERAEP
jgi:hypothetical protein